MIWEREDNQGNSWKYGFTDELVPGFYRVVFQAIVGGTNGDIALDDIKIGPCKTIGDVAF